MLFHIKPLFYPTGSDDQYTHAVSVLTLHPREVKLIIMWSQTVRQGKPKTTAINQDKAGQTLAQRVLERPKQHKPGHNVEVKKNLTQNPRNALKNVTTNALKNVTREDQKACQKNSKFSCGRGTDDRVART